MGNKIILSCSVCASRNYTTNKNQSSSPERLTVKKYCKNCKIHTIHKETK